jgi:hypothetical protein
MSEHELKSPFYEIEEGEAIEFAFDRGWSDGLPVVPPTPEKVQAMLSAAGLELGSQIAFIETRQAVITAEKAAINAVLAGCRPEYMPVVVAAVEALADPAYVFHGPATSTGGAAVFMLVNGPLARELEINSGDNLLGPGWRANATIGRAVRLIMRNVIGALPGTLDRSTIGHAGKYTFCFAEDEKSSPWPPLHVERGFRPEQSTVTVFAALAPHQWYNQLSNTGEGLLKTLCAHLRFSAGVGSQPQYFLIFAGEHRAILAKEGWSKERIREYCFANTQASHAELKRIQVRPGEIAPGDEARMRSLVPSPEDFIIVAAGGEAGAFSAFVPGWSGKHSTQSVTKEIRGSNRI